MYQLVDHHLYGCEFVSRSADAVAIVIENRGGTSWE